MPLAFVSSAVLGNTVGALSRFSALGSVVPVSALADSDSVTVASAKITVSPVSVSITVGEHVAVVVSNSYSDSDSDLLVVTDDPSVSVDVSVSILEAISPSIVDTSPSSSVEGAASVSADSETPVVSAKASPDSTVATADSQRSSLGASEPGSSLQAVFLAVSLAQESAANKLANIESAEPISAEHSTRDAPPPTRSNTLSATLDPMASQDLRDLSRSLDIVVEVLQHDS